MYQFLWIFFIYAFLGWCTEVAYAALKTGHFVNRGFLNGPLCPVYGFGVVIVLGCLTPLKENFLILFLGSVVLTSLLEWLTGFILEKLFRQRWWDYSNEPFNLNGYICLRFSIVWGLACVLVVDVIHPTIELFIHLMPYIVGIICLCVLGIWLVVDLCATVTTITRMNRRLERIDELAAKIRAASNEIGEDLANHVLDAAEKGSDWKETVDAWRAEHQTDLETERRELQERRAALREQLQEFHARLREQLEAETAGQRRLLRAFPDLRSVDRREALERIRRRMEAGRR